MTKPSANPPPGLGVARNRVARARANGADQKLITVQQLFPASCFLAHLLFICGFLFLVVLMWGLYMHVHT